MATMSPPEPTVVLFKSLQCHHCTTLSAIWDKVVIELKKVHPKLRFFTAVASDMSGRFDESKIPKDLKRYTRWFPMILLVPGATWDAAMEHLGPNNPVELTEGVQVLNGQWQNGILSNTGKYDIRSPGGFVQWLKEALNNDEFKSAQSKTRYQAAKSGIVPSQLGIRPIISPNPQPTSTVFPVTTLSSVIGSSGFADQAPSGICSMRMISRPR